MKTLCLSEFWKTQKPTKGMTENLFALSFLYAEEAVRLSTKDNVGQAKLPAFALLEGGFVLMDPSSVTLVSAASPFYFREACECRWCRLMRELWPEEVPA